jgi:hypothetical protein
MPRDLTDAELATAATACRAMAYQEGERVKARSNPDMPRPIKNSAQRFAWLAERFEAARKDVAPSLMESGPTGQSRRIEPIAA